VSSEANLRARVARGGTFTTMAWLEGAASGVLYDTAQWSVAVAELQLTQTPASVAGTVGEAIASSTTLRNVGTAALDAGTFPIPHPAAPEPNNANVQARYLI